MRSLVYSERRSRASLLQNYSPKSAAHNLQHSCPTSRYVVCIEFIKWAMTRAQAKLVERESELAKVMNEESTILGNIARECVDAQSESESDEDGDKLSPINV